MPANRPGFTSVHMNGHLLTAGDIETAGPDFKKHDMLQVAFVPLKPDYTINMDVEWFDMKLKPKREFPENDPFAKVSKKKWIDHTLAGVDPDEAADMFVEWFKDLNLPERKKLAVLGANWSNFDRLFIMEWLGPHAYEHYFHQIRDVQQVGLFLNDVADMNNQPYPFPKVKLSFLCGRLGIINDMPHNALSDAAATAACYKAMLTQPLRVFKVIEEEPSAHSLIEEIFKECIRPLDNEVIEINKMNIELANKLLDYLRKVRATQALRTD